MNAYITNFSLLVRDHVLIQAERLAAQVAAITDEKQVYDLIRRDGRMLLEKLSKAIESSDVGEKAVGQ